jgi:hypothetical protein
VAQRQHGLHRPDEALHLVVVARELRREHLEGDDAVLLGVAGAEDEAALPLGEHLADLVVRQRLADQVVQPFRAAGRPRRRGRRLHHRGLALQGVGLEAQLGLADADNVAGPQRLRLLGGDALAVDQGAGGAAAVHDDDVVAVHLHLAVDARHVRVGEARLGVLAAADDQRHRLVDGEGAALVGAADDDQLQRHERPPGGRARGPAAGRRTDAWPRVAAVLRNKMVTETILRGGGPGVKVLPAETAAGGEGCSGANDACLGF